MKRKDIMILRISKNIFKLHQAKHGCGPIENCKFYTQDISKKLYTLENFEIFKIRIQIPDSLMYS